MSRVAPSLNLNSMQAEPEPIGFHMSLKVVVTLNTQDLKR